VRALATMLLAAAAFSFGCGGRVQAEPAGTDRGRTQHFTLSDAGSIASAGPAASAWTWLAKPAPPEQGEIRSQDPLIVALRRRLGRLTSKGDADHKWIDHDKLAHLGVGVYPNSREAHDALEALDAFALGIARRMLSVTRDADIQGLGDEAHVVLARGATGPEATYHWRRANLLVEAHMQCFGTCPGKVAAAARRWAEAVDASAARSGRGT
jgi:hypothetical protein